MKAASSSLSVGQHSLLPGEVAAIGNLAQHSLANLEQSGGPKWPPLGACLCELIAIWHELGLHSALAANQLFRHRLASISGSTSPPRDQLADSH